MRAGVDDGHERGAVVDAAGVAGRDGAVRAGTPGAAGPAAPPSARRAGRSSRGHVRRAARSRRRSRRPAAVAIARACERAAYSSWARRGDAELAREQRRRPAPCRDRPARGRERGALDSGSALAPSTWAARTATAPSTPTPLPRPAPHPARRAAIETAERRSAASPLRALPVDGQRRARVTGSPACSAATRRRRRPAPCSCRARRRGGLPGGLELGRRAPLMHRRGEVGGGERGQRAARRPDGGPQRGDDQHGRVRLAAHGRSGRQRGRSRPVPARSATAARSTLPPAVTGQLGQVEPQPRPLRRRQLVPRRRPGRGQRRRVGDDGRRRAARAGGAARPTTTTSAPAAPAQRLLDVGDQHGGAAGDARPRRRGRSTVSTPPARLPRSPTVAKPSAATANGPSAPR